MTDKIRREFKSQRKQEPLNTSNLQVHAASFMFCTANHPPFRWGTVNNWFWISSTRYHIELKTCFNFKWGCAQPTLASDTSMRQLDVAWLGATGKHRNVAVHKGTTWLPCTCATATSVFGDFSLAVKNHCVYSNLQNSLFFAIWTSNMLVREMKELELGMLYIMGNELENTTAIRYEYIIHVKLQRFNQGNDNHR